MVALLRESRPSEDSYDLVQSMMSRLVCVVWYGSAHHLTAIESQVNLIKNELDNLVNRFQSEHENQFPPKELPDSKLMNKQDRDDIEQLPITISKPQ